LSTWGNFNMYGEIKDYKYVMYLTEGKTFNLTQREYEGVIGRMDGMIPRRIIVTISNKRILIFTDKIISIEEI
jgi:hypothetical protein